MNKKLYEIHLKYEETFLIGEIIYQNDEFMYTKLYSNLGLEYSQSFIPLKNISEIIEESDYLDHFKKFINLNYEDITNSILFKENVNTDNLHANTIYQDLIGEYIYIYLYDSDEMLEGRLEKDEQDHILVSSEKIYKETIKHIMLDDLKDRIALL